MIYLSRNLPLFWVKIDGTITEILELNQTFEKSFNAWVQDYVLEKNNAALTYVRSTTIPVLAMYCQAVVRR